MRLKPVAGSVPGEWTLEDRERSFDRVAASPKGGFVVLGAEGRNSDKHFLLRIAEDGTPRWAVRFTRGSDVVEPDLAVDDSGSMALLSQHTGGITFEGRELVHGEPRAVVLSLLLLSDEGELKQALSQKRETLEFSRRITGADGFVTSSVDLFEPYQAQDDGLSVIGIDGREVRRETTGAGFEPKLLSSGSSLVVVGKQDGAFKLRGRTVAPAPPQGRSAWIVASFAPDLGLRWAHPFTDARFRDATAVAQDERGHVFAAFRYGESHGFADDLFAAVVYELDERGREVHHFTYGPSVTVAHLFPAPEGLTLIGFSWQMEVQLKGHPLALPLGESSHDEYPDLFLRVDPEGKPLAQREYREPEANVWTPAHQTTIADVAPAGPGFLAVVGRVTRDGPFAGLRVAKGEPERPYIARIRRP